MALIDSYDTLDRIYPQKLTRTGHHGVVALIRLEGHLFDRLKVTFTEFFDFSRKDGLSGHRRVNTAGLDRNDGVAPVFQEACSIETDNTGLVGLRDVGEDGVDGRQQDSVLVGKSGVLDNGFINK